MRTFEMYEGVLIERLAKGLQHYQIADELRLPEDSVRQYIQEVKKKWRAKNTPNLIHLWHTRNG